MVQVDTKPMYVGVAEVQRDWGLSRSSAYSLIKRLSARMQQENPNLIVLAGKINRIYYEEACGIHMKSQFHEKGEK